MDRAEMKMKNPHRKIENDFDLFSPIEFTVWYTGDDGREKLSMNKSAFGFTVNDREIPSLFRLVKVVALRCRHNVQKLFTIHTQILPPTYPHTHTWNHFVEYFALFILRSKCIHILTADMYVLCPLYFLDTAKKTNVSTIKFVFRMVYPNHVSTQ